MNSELRKKRIEANRPLLKKGTTNEHGLCCVNCGRLESIELHHIVPLFLGGENRPSNIVPLCHSCHMAAHHGRNMKEYRNNNYSGRPHKISYDEALPILEEYFNGNIGTKEANEKLGYSKNSHLADRPICKKYKKENDIIKFRNNIDIHIFKKCLCENKQVGYVIKKDGTHIALYYKANNKKVMG